MSNANTRPPLETVLFIVVWVAAYGVGWLMVNAVNLLGYYLPGTYTNEVIGNVSAFENWQVSLSYGLFFAIPVMMVQGWALQERFQFVPRFWRLATVIGLVLSGFSLYTLLLNSQPNAPMYMVHLFVWFALTGILQSLVLWRVSRLSGVIAIIGTIAGLIASGVVGLGILGIYANSLAFVIGSVIQIVGTGAMMLVVMEKGRKIKVTDTPLAQQKT